jgi:hypothetical protein
VPFIGPGAGGKMAAIKTRSGDELQRKRGGKEGGVGCGEMRRGWGAFYRCRGEAGWSDGRGERPAVVERHDGGGGGRFGRGSTGEWCSVRFRSGKGRGAVGCACACEASVAAPAGQPGEEDDRAGRAGWAGQRPRPSGGLAAVAQKKGKESGPAGVEGEAGCGWAESGVGPEFKRNCF